MQEKSYTNLCIKYTKALMSAFIVFINVSRPVNSGGALVVIKCCRNGHIHMGKKILYCVCMQVAPCIVPLQLMIIKSSTHIKAAFKQKGRY